MKFFEFNLTSAFFGGGGNFAYYCIVIELFFDIDFHRNLWFKVFCDQKVSFSRNWSVCLNSHFVLSNFVGADTVFSEGSADNRKYNFRRLFYSFLFYKMSQVIQYLSMEMWD